MKSIYKSIMTLSFTIIMGQGLCQQAVLGLREMFEDDGSYRNSEWYQITERDYIFKAFQKAHEMDPDTELYYND